MATVDSAFRYWFDRFVIDSGMLRTDANSAIARAAFSAGRKAQATDYAALQQRCEALAETAVKVAGEAERWKARAEAAEAERDALRRDAVRYRWIEANATVQTEHWTYWHDDDECTPLVKRIDAALHGQGAE